MKGSKRTCGGETGSEARMRKEKFLWLLLWGTILLMMAGCGRKSEAAALEEDVGGQVAGALPKGESIEETRILEKEKTKEAIRYQVYVRVDIGKTGEIREKCYLVTYRRQNGKWVCDEQKVQLVEDKVVGEKGD